MLNSLFLLQKISRSQQNIKPPRFLLASSASVESDGLAYWITLKTTVKKCSSSVNNEASRVCMFRKSMNCIEKKFSNLLPAGERSISCWFLFPPRKSAVSSNLRAGNGRSESTPRSSELMWATAGEKFEEVSATGDHIPGHRSTSAPCWRQRNHAKASRVFRCSEVC